MTPQDLADQLNGCDYPLELSPALLAEAKANRLVIVTGASDDLMLLSGALSAELGCYQGGPVALSGAGWDLAGGAEALIYARWQADPSFRWTYKTRTAHSTFEQRRNGEPFCRGIVFSLGDVVREAPPVDAGILAAVLDSLDYTLMIGFRDHPTQGQLVATGPVAGAGGIARRIGYCVQVRRRCGQFGSDMVFLRHADGGLMTHENQCFFALTPEQEAKVRPYFLQLPEDEDYSQGYSCTNKVHETGFLVDGSLSPPAPVDPMHVKVTTRDGTSEKVTMMAFV